MDRTYRHIAERFKIDLDRTGAESDDSGWSNKSIIDAFLNIRTPQVEAALLRGDNVPEDMKQHLGCVSVKEADRQECPCAPASGCYWLRTTDPIPTPIRIFSLMDTLAKDNIDFVLWKDARGIPKHRIPSIRTRKFYAIKDIGNGLSHIYIYNDRNLKAVALTAIFESPIDAAAYPSCGEVDLDAFCNPMDVALYTSRAFVENILRQMWAEMYPRKETAPQDVFNNQKKDGNQPS